MGDSTSRDGPMAGARMRAPDETKSGGHGDSSAFHFTKSHHDEKGLPDLLRDLAHQGSHLAEQQTKLVEAEVRAATTDLKESLGAMAGAGVVGIAGLGVLLMGIAYLLAEAMPLWAATLLVAVATLAGAYAMFAAGKKKLQSKAMTMERTRHTIERAPSAMSNHERDMHNGR